MVPSTTSALYSVKTWSGSQIQLALPFLPQLCKSLVGFGYACGVHGAAAAATEHRTSSASGLLHALDHMADFPAASDSENDKITVDDAATLNSNRSDRKKVRNATARPQQQLYGMQPCEQWTVIWRC